MTLAPGRVLAGRYLVGQHVATGGMAQVWRARDEVLGRTVAIKVLRDNLADDPAFRARFHREAVAAAHLTHPSIVSVYDTGVDGDVVYIVMEYVAGRTLAELRRERGTFDLDDAVGVAVPVLEALGYAHERGVVHRDIKPENILVGEDGRVRVADFGIAKAAFAGGDLTTTGQVLGTVRYLSPEQVGDAEADARSDLYSMGVVLYELLTGRAPFSDENPVTAAMLRLTTAPVPPRDIRPALPRDVQAVVLKSLARRPEDRYQSAAAMCDALLRTAGAGVPAPGRGASPANEHPTQALAPAPGPGVFRSWMLVPLVVVLLAAVAIGVGFGIGRLQVGGPLGIKPKPSPAGSPVRIAIRHARDFDPPPGDGSEHPSEVANTVDGNRETVWSTDRYTTAAFGQLKPGVGIWFDLGGERVVRTVEVSSPLPGWTFQLRAGPAPSRTGKPLRSSGGATRFKVGDSGRVKVSLPPTRMRGVMIWITELAPDSGRFAARIGEVTVLGQAA
jgi:eukaryotic-like serine/threonine-protein kinase